MFYFLACKICKAYGLQVPGYIFDVHQYLYLCIYIHTLYYV